MILSTNKSEREFSSLATKQEVSFCSDHLSDFLQKAITCSKSNHLRFAKDSKTVVDSLLPATENKYKEVFKFIEQMTQQ